MVMHTFQEYLDILDNQVTKRNNLSPSELLEFVKLTQAKESHRQDFTEKRRIVWFGLVSKRLGDFTSSNLVTLWKQVSNAKIKPETYNRIFTSEWEKSLVRCLEKGDLLDVLEIYLQASSLAFVIYAFGHMRLRPEEEFVRVWVERVPPKVPEFSPAAVADFIFGVGKLWLKEDSILTTVNSLIENCETNQVAKMSAPDLIRTLYGLCELKIDPMNLNPKFMEIYSERVRSKMDKLTPKELSTAGWNISRCNIDADSAFIKTWTRVVLASMKDFSPRDLYLSLLAAVHFKQGDEFATPWMDIATSHVKYFWPQALAAVLMDLHFIEVRPSSAFLIEWEKATRRNFPEMYTKDLVATMVGLAMIEKEPHSTFLDDWYVEVKKKAERFTQNSMDDLEKAFSALNLEIRKDVEEELKKAAKIHRSEQDDHTAPDSRQKAYS